MAPKPSIHHFKPDFRPLGFRAPRWQNVFSYLYRPGRFSRYMLSSYRRLLNRNHDLPRTFPKFPISA